MIRRTPMAWRYPAHAASAAHKAARLMGAELGWNAEREACEVAEFANGAESEPDNLMPGSQGQRQERSAGAGGPHRGGARGIVSAGAHQSGL